MNYALVAFPAAPVRKKPAHQSEMVNQLLFGEAVRVIKDRGDLWVKVCSLHDGYEGWMTYNLLQPVDREIAEAPANFVSTNLLSPISTGNTTMHIPAGALLPGFKLKGGKGKLGEKEYTCTAPVIDIKKMMPGENLLEELTTPWLHAPYLWGGRTPLGVDCSGFVQVVYRQMGINLPRDAGQQAKEGSEVKKFSDAKPGDLLFFDNKEDIVHVGILLNNNKMIHASGKVRIDEVNKKGILNPDPRSKKTRLRAVRRVW